MSQVLKDNVAIITGGGRGLGKAYAIRFASEGAKLLLPDISLERAEAVAKEIRGKGGEAAAMKTDISDENATREIAQKVMDVYGRVDILLNNAATYYGVEDRPWDSWTVEEWDRMFEVNVKGTWLCCKAIAPLMVNQKKGKIINISSSIISNFAGQFMLHYACSKAAVLQMTQQLARALGPHGINVNAIAPGYTYTEASVSSGSGESWDMAIREQCIKRREEPEDLIGTVLFLASKDSDFMTGQLLVADGGSWLR